MQLRVLVVEDQQVVAADFEQKLARMGCEVVGTAVAGKEAVEKVLRLRPDIVLMDIWLQGDMDGMEAARLYKVRRCPDCVYHRVQQSAHPKPGKAGRTQPFPVEARRNPSTWKK